MYSDDDSDYSDSDEEFDEKTRDPEDQYITKILKKRVELVSLKYMS